MGAGVRISGEEPGEQRWAVYLHRNQKVIVWGTGYSPDGAEKVIVTYSRLHNGGRIGFSNTKSVWEDDFYEEFQRISLGPEAAVKLRWEEVDED